MQYDEVLANRWSCRAFLSDPVPDEIIEYILTQAQLTPSWCNVQPWQVWLVRGAARDAFAAGLTEYVETHAVTNGLTPDLDMPPAYEGESAERRRKSGFALYEAIGLEPSDSQGRETSRKRNFRFFDAPVVAIITSKTQLGTYGAVDCGAYVTNVQNLAISRGLGAIAQGAVASHSEGVRKLLGIPHDQSIVCGIALGYPDLDNPVNQFRTERAELADVVIDVKQVLAI